MIEGPVWLVCAVVHEEGFGGVRLDEGLERGQGDDLLKAEDALGGDMELPAARGPVARLGEQHREAPHVMERAEVVILVLVTVLPVAMVVHAGQEHGAARAAARGRGKGMREANALRRELVQARRLDHPIAVSAERFGAVVVRDEEHDVSVRGTRRRGEHRQPDEQHQ